MPKPVVVIVGSTASGKSQLGMELAWRYGGEIICADSRTVYKGLDIGTAKPSLQDQREVPHHLLDIVTPGQSFTAADFQMLARKAIKDIQNRGKLPIIVGGTGLYIDALIFDYRFGKPADAATRDKLNTLSTAELVKRCIDNNITLPENSSNKRHLVRALELGGLINDPKVLHTDTLVVGLSTQKEILHKRIEQRAHAMLKAGILKEVRQMGERYGWDNEAMKGNIYRVFKVVLEGEQTLEEALPAVVQADLRLAKRQLTWFKRNPHIHWGAAAELKTIVHTFLLRTGYIS